jgi:hypothetical protein
MSGIQMLVEVNVKQLKHYFLPASYTILILGFFLFPSSKSISNFFYLAVVAPFVILIIMKKVDLRSLLFSRTFLLVSIYLVYMVCTLFWADSLGLSDLSKYGRRVLYILIFLGVTIHLTQSYPTLLKGLIMVLCGTAAIVAIANVLFFYRQHPFPSTRLFGYGLLHMPFKASSIYGIIVLACMYIILTQHSTSVRLAYLGLLLVSFSYMLLAQSRSSLLALVSAMIVWLFMAYPGFFEEAFLRGYSPRRLELWGKLLARVEEAPWFGHGLTASPRTEISYGRILFHPHSVYVGTLLYGGIVGLLLLVAAVISALWQGFGCGRQPINLAAATMVLYGTLCIGLNGNMLIHHVKPFWLFFWFPVALVIASEIPGHPLYGKSRMPSERDGKSAAARLE